jgi:hypothetical protein
MTLSEFPNENEIFIYTRQNFVGRPLIINSNVNNGITNINGFTSLKIGPRTRVFFYITNDFKGTPFLLYNKSKISSMLFQTFPSWSSLILSIVVEHVDDRRIVYNPKNKIEIV